MCQLTAQEAALGQARASAETHGVYRGGKGKPGQFRDVSACFPPPNSIRKVTVATGSLVTLRYLRAPRALQDGCAQLAHDGLRSFPLQLPKLAG